MPRDEDEHGNQPKNRQGSEHLIDTVQGVILEIIDIGIKNTQEIDDTQDDCNCCQRERGKCVYFDLLRGGILVHCVTRAFHILLGNFYYTQ